jgi:ankyrin repeat protein
MKDLGADIDGAKFENGAAALSIAAQIGNVAVLQCLVMELHADVNQAAAYGATPLYVAAQGGFAVVRCLVEDLGAKGNEAMHDGST